MKKLAHLLLWVVIVVTSTTAAYPRQAAKGPDDKEVIVAFRFDDYSSISDTSFEIRLLEEFERHRVPFTMAVVPFAVEGNGTDRTIRPLVPLNDEKTRILKAAMNSNGIEVALHGYSHQTVTRRWTGDYSEFNDLDYTSQALRVETGKKFLEEKFGAKVTTFVPPFDNFDSVTTRVVEDHGFEVFSANVDQRADIAPGSKLKYLPATTSLTDLRSAVEAALLLPGKQSAIVVLIHRRDFPSNRNATHANQTGELPELLQWLGQTEGVSVVTLQEASRRVKDLSAERFLGFYDRFLLRLIPRPMQQAFKFPVGVYYSDPGTFLRVKMVGAVALLYLGIVLVAFAGARFAGAALFTRWTWMKSLLVYAAPACIVILAAYDLRNLVIRYRSAMILTALFGISVGIWKSARVRRTVSQVSEH